MFRSYHRRSTTFVNVGSSFTPSRSAWGTSSVAFGFADGTDKGLYLSRFTDSEALVGIVEVGGSEE